MEESNRAMCIRLIYVNRNIVPLTPALPDVVGLGRVAPSMGRKPKSGVSASAGAVLQLTF